MGPGYRKRNDHMVVARIFCMMSALLLVSAGLSAAAHAQAYPAKPVRIIVPSSTGGAVDGLARLVAQISTSLGQQVIADNRPGANGAIGLELAARSPADGHTLVLGFLGPLAVNPGLYKKLPYDSLKDFAPITLVAESPLLIVAHPSLPARSVRDLIQFAKARPGQVTYGTGGTGTGGHLTVELFKITAGIDLLHVPYKGVGPALIDVLAGHISLMASSPISSQPHVKSGRLRGLAVTGRARSPALPEVPTMIEAGLANFESTTWFGVLAPAGTPPAIVNRLNSEINTLLRQPEVREQIARLGADPAGNTPEQFAAHIRAEIAKWAKVIKAANIQVN
jgi:tripartite-type tricarboxylate transporter receptor subunit TctC